MPILKNPYGNPPNPTPGPIPGQTPGATDWQEMARQARALAGNQGRGGMPANLEELTRQATLAQQAAMQQMSATQGAADTAAKTGNVRPLMAALGMVWSSDFAKRCDCVTCGAAKKLGSPTAYIYCDYCGSLADYDFRRACESESAPSAEFISLANSMHGVREQAKAAGDRDGYREAQIRFYDGYVANYPQAVSHRVGDPKYRAALVRFLAENSVIDDFDPTFAALADDVKEKAKALQWSGGMTSPKVSGSSFRAMAEVLAKQVARGTELAQSADLIDLDPDHAGSEVRRRMIAATLCQGWLPHLEAEDAKWLIDGWGLDGEYFKLEVPSDGQNWHCGVCGGEIMVLKGAKIVVCDHCGHSIDIGGGESPCRNCGGMITFPVGESHIPCPYCKADAERVGWA
jgi:DNA-directed RNA polymerase subunit RPC12/RpoP